MRAVLCERWGEPEVLRLSEIEATEPGAGEVRLAVHAAGVNFADILMVAGQYQEKPAFPFTPGLEAAGVVEAVGEEVDAETGRHVERRALRPGDDERRVGRALSSVGWRQILEAHLDTLPDLWVVRECKIAKQQDRDGGEDGREAALH